MDDELAFLGHREEDSVAVAVRDVSPGTQSVAFLTSTKRSKLETSEAIPLGHKVALVPLKEGSSVIEYGEIVGTATKNISIGELVHVHNIRSNKWQIKA